MVALNQDFATPSAPTVQVPYYGFRYYDPETGRWPSRDPIGEAGSVSWFQRFKEIEEMRAEVFLSSVLSVELMKLQNASSESLGGLNLFGFINNDPINDWDILGEKAGRISTLVAGIATAIAFASDAALAACPAIPCPVSPAGINACKTCCRAVGAAGEAAGHTARAAAIVSCWFAKKKGKNGIGNKSARAICIAGVNKGAKDLINQVKVSQGNCELSCELGR